MSERVAVAAVQGRSAAVADGSTFAPALRLLRGRFRADVESLYRVLRTIDDLVDDEDPRALERVQALEDWAIGGPAQSPEAQALAQLARSHPLIRRDALLHFCEGMRHDIARGSIDTEGDFLRYCQQAGGSVGEVLASLLGAAKDDPEGRREAQTGMATLGRAMQVTNILRDIDEDLAHGRIYIPRAAIERLGFPAAGARDRLLREEIARADALYEQGERAIPLLRGGREAMALAATLYRDILRQIETNMSSCVR